MGKKYVIEISDNYFCEDLGIKYWRIKGVNGFILDEDELSKLEEYKEPELGIKIGHIYRFASSGKDVCVTRIINHGFQIYYMFRDGSYSCLPGDSFKDNTSYIGKCGNINDFLKEA